jgi:hypothetical protein
MVSNNLLTDEINPGKFYLGQNYPNPFKENTVIKYCVADKTKVQITVCDSESNIIEKLVDEEKNPGTYEVEFRASRDHSGRVRRLSDGYYFYLMEVGNKSCDKKWFCKNNFYGKITIREFLHTFL